MKKILLLVRFVIPILTLTALVLITGHSTLTEAQGPNNFLDAADGNPQKAVYVDDNGKVGIGTRSPMANLEIVGSNKQTLEIITLDQVTGVSKDNINVIWGGYTRLQSMLSNGVAESQMQFRNQFAFMSVKPEIGSTKEIMTLKEDGKVGIGTDNPKTNLDIGHGPSWTSANWGASIGLSNGSAIGWAANDAGQRVGVGHTNAGFVIFRTASDLSTTDSPVNDDFVISDTGDIGIGTNRPNTKLDVVGTTRTKVLEITGGSDLAEPFRVADSQGPQPGMVAVIDPDHPGQLRLSDKAYDRMVAGVISGAGGVAPGLTMHQAGTIAEGDHLVSLTGRVYVWVDASYGAIQPGDLLTTSDTLGYAMKVTNHEQAQGAILGKAMTALASGKGLVLALISLQ